MVKRRKFTISVENNAMGHGVLLLNTTGSSNIGIGAFAMNNNTTGYSNIAIGSRAYIAIGYISMTN